MKKSYKQIVIGAVSLSIIIFIGLIIAIFSMASKPNWPQEITVKNAYSFATIGEGRTAAAFMSIQNGLEADDALIGATSDIADITEIHENMIDPDDGKMMMRKVSRVDAPSMKSATLSPKGYHVMFVGLKEPLLKGTTFPLTLIFEQSGTQTVTVNVTAAGEAAHP